ncbi:MAG: hypothetical protein NVS9B12_04720 [Vulcanimicrobiaceae bacterium]
MESAQLAQRYAREHEVVRALLSTLLPRTLPPVENLEFSAIYEPAIAEDLFGGDWYDAFAIDESQVLISVGDVTGHGLPAAALMGKLVQSLRALAIVETSPSELIRLLDQLVQRENSDAMATAFVGVLNAATGHLCYANAGHCTPLLRLREGSIAPIAAHGLPLGVRAPREHSENAVTMPADSLLVLYTDGLTEATRDILRGEALLREALRSQAPGRSPNISRALADTVLGGKPTLDDVAVMTVHYKPLRHL